MTYGITWHGIACVPYTQYVFQHMRLLTVGFLQQALSDVDQSVSCSAQMCFSVDKALHNRAYTCTAVHVWHDPGTPPT